MPRMYRLSHAGSKILYKIRHHRGHGIHSPFVFNLINKVIEEKTPFYAFNDIQTQIKETDSKLILRKFNFLSFRLVNYFNAKKILELGAGRGVNSMSITASATDITCTSVEQDSTKAKMATKLWGAWNRNITLHNSIPSAYEKLDAIFIDLNHYKNLTTADILKLQLLVHDKSFIVVKGIRTNKRHRLLWETMIATEERTAVLDLFSVGIVFFDKQLYRWEYQISY